MYRSARISRCKQYRYQLTRIWEVSMPSVCFVMLNPSAADATKDDPTIRRCIRFAQNWGFGGLEVINLYAYRTPNPKELENLPDPIGPRNAYYVRKVIKSSRTIVCAWGNKKGNPMNQNILPKADYHYLALAKDGTPKHPLYLKNDLVPIQYFKSII